MIHYGLWKRSIKDWSINLKLNPFVVKFLFQNSKIKLFVAIYQPPWRLIWNPTGSLSNYVPYLSLPLIKTGLVVIFNGTKPQIGGSYLTHLGQTRTTGKYKLESSDWFTSVLNENGFGFGIFLVWERHYEVNGEYLWLINILWTWKKLLFNSV